MFATHQKRIQEYARGDPQHMARVLKFVILTIRNRFYNLPADMETLDTGGNVAGELESVLYGFKMAAINQIDSEIESIYAQAESIFFHAETRREAAEGLLNLYTGIFGLGLAKAGFVAQLCYGVSACLDSHNIARFDIPWAHMKSSTFKNVKRMSTRAMWIRRYCEYVEKAGDTESLWDSWCELLVTRPDETGFKMNGNRAAYKSAFHVSGIHCESLGLAAD